MRRGFKKISLVGDRVSRRARAQAAIMAALSDKRKPRVFKSFAMTFERVKPYLDLTDHDLSINPTDNEPFWHSDVRNNTKGLKGRECCVTRGELLVLIGGGFALPPFKSSRVKEVELIDDLTTRAAKAQALPEKVPKASSKKKKKQKGTHREDPLDVILGYSSKSLFSAVAECLAELKARLA